MDSADTDDMLASLDPVVVRRMFGDKRAHHRGRIVTVEIGGDTLLKADAASAPAFAAVGARRWTYEGHGGKAVEMPYWTVPADAWDDPDAMARWVRLAWEAAVRAGEGKPERSGAARGRPNDHGS